VRKIIIIGSTLLILLFLSACVSTSSSSTPCLIGIWEVADPEEFAIAVLSPDSYSPESHTFLKGNNQLAYKFDEEGNVSVLAVELNSVFAVSSAIGDLKFELWIDGAAEGKYRTNGNIITVYSVTKNQIRHAAYLADKQLVDSFYANEFLPLFNPPYNSARFDCAGDTIVFQIFNRLGETITLQRSE